MKIEANWRYLAKEKLEENSTENAKAKEKTLRARHRKSAVAASGIENGETNSYRRSSAAHGAAKSMAAKYLTFGRKNS